MTSFPGFWSDLARPFGPHEVKSRAAPGGRQLRYVTARTVMNRLDDVVSPENWWDDYTPMAQSVVCRLTIRLPDGRTLTKSDAGGYAGMQDQGDDDKSGFSDALKRAAAKFGVGRYLYGDGTPRFEAAPDVEASSIDPAPAHLPASEDAPRGDGPPESDVPITGKQLMAWGIHEQEERGIKFLHKLQEWGLARDFPPKVIDYTEAMVREAWPRACRLRDVALGLGDPDDRPAKAPAEPSGTDPVKFVKASLYKRVFRLAQVQFNAESPTLGNVRCALKLLDGDVEGPGRIASLRDCDSFETLGAYCTAAELKLNRLAPAREEALVP